MLEQRKSRRFNLKLPLELLRPGLQVVRSGETRNVSACGILFSADLNVQPGQRIEYAIMLPADQANVTLHLRCVGKVVRRVTETETAATMERYEFVRKQVQ